MKFHWNRLFAALVKYYRPMTYREFMREMDIPMTNDAIAVAQLPKEVADWIWEKERQPFEVTPIGW